MIYGWSFLFGPGPPHAAPEHQRPNILWAASCRALDEDAPDEWIDEYLQMWDSYQGVSA